MSQYRPLDLVGQGQYGQVFLAYSQAERGLVALKALHPQRFPTRNFLRELRFLLGLNHPHIVRCHTLDYWQGRRCLVMDYGEGGTLRGLLEQEEHLPIVLALELTTEILSGLQYIHERGIIHCDIKPENILLRLTRHGWRAQVSDLGVARLEVELESGGQTGSPAYMAPERFYGQYLPASDLYGVGVLLFEMIVGRRPFQGSPLELISAHLSHVPDISPGLPYLVQTLLRKSLTKLPQKRYQSAAEMIQAVRLAHDILLSEGQQYYPLFPKSAPWNLAWEAATTYSLSQPLTALISQGTDAVGWGEGKLLRFFRDGQPSDVINPAKTVNHFSPGIETYWFETTEGEIYQADQPQPVLTVGAGANLQVWAIERAGKWLAQASQDMNTHLTIMNLKTGQVYTARLPKSQGLSGRIQQIIPINARYGLVVIASSHADKTTLLLFNRRGKVLLSTEVPIRLTHVTQAQKNSWHFAALTPDQPQAMILMRLKPWCVQRIILGFKPQWLTATPWGYAVADQITVAGISESGELLGGIGLKPSLTALVSAGERGLWLASWNGTAGKLQRVEFSQMGLDLIM